MALRFDVRKYKDDGQILVDGSDALANRRRQVISFQNIRNNKDVYFKAFITSYNETFTPNFNATEVFGRIDPIQQYKGTTRNITLAWKLPAASESEAYENLGRVQDLLNMLYPSYLDVNNAATLSEAPLVRLKVMNLLTSHPGRNLQDTDKASQFKENESTSNLFFSYMTEDDSSHGMLGVITSCTVNHNLEGQDGVFEKVAEDEDGRIIGGFANTILPKLIDINISFTPLHEYTPGANNPVGPYGVKLDNVIGSDTIKRERIVEQGYTMKDLIRIKDEIEKKRRNAASAQQAMDKQKAALRKAKRKARRIRGGGDSDQAADREVARLEESIDFLEQRAEVQNEQLESLEDII